MGVLLLGRVRLSIRLNVRMRSWGILMNIVDKNTGLVVSQFGGVSLRDVNIGFDFVSYPFPLFSHDILVDHPLLALLLLPHYIRILQRACGCPG